MTSTHTKNVQIFSKISHEAIQETAIGSAPFHGFIDPNSAHEEGDDDFGRKQKSEKRLNAN